MNVKKSHFALKTQKKNDNRALSSWHCKKLCYVIEYKKEEKGAEGIEKKACDF